MSHLASKGDATHLSWVANAAGATLYLHGLYLRLGDSKQAARADKAGRAVQEQIVRLTPDASARVGQVVHALDTLERAEGDTISEQRAWGMALNGLLALAIWAGVADSLQERLEPSPIGKKTSRALHAALEAAQAAFPNDERSRLFSTFLTAALRESLDGIAALMVDQGHHDRLLMEDLAAQVEESVCRYLAPWTDDFQPKP